MDIPERVAKVETWQDVHTDQCKERYQAIMGDTTEIKESLLMMSRDLKLAVERIHTRIDDESGKARHALNNQIMASNSQFKDVEKEASKTDSRIDKQKIWNLSAVLVSAAAVIAWLVEKLFGK